MRLSQVLVAAFEASCLFQNVLAVASTDTLMDGDSSQSGYAPNHNMDPAVIAGGSFGQIWSYSTPTGTSEQFYAKPLVFTPSTTGRQVVLSFSEQNRIYSLDAVNGTLLATRDLSLEGEPPFSVADLGSCNDISGSIGVTGTPVIDPTTDTIYFWAKSYLGTTKGYQNGAYRFHAIDAVTLQEKPGFPTNIQGARADNDNTRFFTGGTVLQRPSLNLVNGVVFAGFGGHCDQYNFTGWVVGMSASSGKLLTSYVTSGGPGSPPQDGTWTGGGGGAGIWMAGSAISSDQSGRLFFATGNAYKTFVNQNIPASGRLKLNTLSEAVVNMEINATTGAVTQQDYFEPYTYRAMDEADRDLGSGGVTLPDPGTFSGGGVSRLAITVGKNGVAYVMNADNLGGYKLGSGGTDAIIQTISMPGGGSVFGNAGTYPLEGGFMYITPVGYPTLVYSLGFTPAGVPAFTLVAQTPDVSAARVGTGSATITTYKGQSGSGILWIVDPDAGIRAYNAVPNGGVMTKINLPSSPSVSKFQRPAFGDGRYYLSTSNGKILAFGSPVALPLTCTSPIDFGSVPIGNTKTLNVTCVANIKITKLNGFILGKAVYTASNSSLPTGALAVGASFTFPVTFDLTNHQLNAGSTSSSSVTPGVQTTSISILTTNGVTGFAPQQPITLTGMSISSAPFLTMNPLQVDFEGIVVGSAAAETGSDSTFIINNVGLGNMTILGMAYTNTSISNPNSIFHNVTATVVNGVNGVAFDINGVFTSTNMPAIGTVIKGGGSVTISANFKTSITGNYYTMLQIYTDGGNAYTVFTGSAATTPVAKLQYSTAEGGWNTIPACAEDVEGCSYEVNFAPSGGLTSQTIQLKLTNMGGSALTITKSKPLEGTELGATNPSTDFSEGLTIVPGNSVLASISFSPGSAVLNADDVNYEGVWTLNTDDLTFGVHSIVFKGSVVSAKTGPVTAQGTSLYKYLGCYQDYVNNVRLEPKQYVNANMTNGMCQTQAQTYGAVFAGSEYFTECWVGSVIPAASALNRDSFCSYQCGGDSSQLCGGPNGYISIYYDSTRYFPANGTIIGATGASPSRPATVGNFKYAGCYSDVSTARVLTGKTQAGATTTLESCATLCAAFTYFGTEYANECYCGNTLGASSVIKPDSDCSMNCAGNSAQFCGAGSRLSLYVRNGTSVPSAAASSTTKPVSSSTKSGSSTSVSATASSTPAAKFKSLGCWSDADVTQRTLIGGASADGAMTIELCAANCQGFDLFGVEYGQECYCGPAISSNSVLTTDGRCSMPCAGDASEICGGSYGMNIYSYVIASSTYVPSSTSSSVRSSSPSSSSLTTSLKSTLSSTLSSSSTAQSTTTSSSTLSTTPTASVVAIPPFIGSWTYLHCRSDNITIRTLQGKYTANSAMTLENCATACAGYTYFGVEYYSECYCSNTLSYGSFITTDGRCNMKCLGNANEICGGDNGITLYQNIPVVAGNSSSSTLSATSSSSIMGSVSSSTLLLSSSWSSMSSTKVLSSTSFLTSSSSSSLPLSSLSSTSSSISSTASSTLSSSSLVTSSITSSSSLSSSTPSSTFVSSSTILSSTTVSSSSVLSSVTLLSSSSTEISVSTSSVGASSTPQSSSIVQSSSSSQATTSSSSSSALSSSTLSSQFSSQSSSTSASSSSSSSSSLADLTTSATSVLSSSSTILSSSSYQPTTSSQTTSSSSTFIYSTTLVSQTSSSSSLSSSSPTSSMQLSSSAILSSSSSFQTSSSRSTTLIATSISTTSSTLPSASSNPWAYIGCANDTVTARALTGGGTTNTTGMTPEYCQAFCMAKNLNLAGIEYGSECYCGSALAHNSTLGQTGCTTACPGSKSQTCGGSSRLSIYNLTTYIPPSIPATITLPSPSIAKWNYTGCYTELTNARALTGYTVTNATAMTLDMCVATCAAKGYAVSGNQYGTQCFCGNALSPVALAAGKLSDKECMVLLCPGNKLEWCSAGSRLLVYQAS